MAMFYLSTLMDSVVCRIAVIADVPPFASACLVFVAHGRLYKICPENQVRLLGKMKRRL